jgi:catechol 2,3-dioxygenase-like lactoylglutathione lyase family enzyme
MAARCFARSCGRRRARASPYTAALRRVMLPSPASATATRTIVMPIQKMDHFTILTKDWKATANFYEDILGFKAGARPNFAFPGCWLHNDGKPILHVIERPEIPKETGLLDHMAFSATGLADYIGKLKARNIKYDLRRVPEGGYAAGVWQVFFLDPNGAKVELDFAKEESAPAET